LTGPALDGSGGLEPVHAAVPLTVMIAGGLGLALIDSRDIRSPSPELLAARPLYVNRFTRRGAKGEPLTVLSRSQLSERK
jgi:hypothetical protein